jgi:hypothetical protein
VTDAVLATAFQRYSSFQRARVVMHRGTGKSRGFGFVSLGDAIEGARVLKEMQGKYIGEPPPASCPTLLPCACVRACVLRRSRGAASHPPPTHTHSPSPPPPAGNRPVQLKKSNWDERNITDRKTGKAVKREIEVRPDDNRPGKKVAKGFGVLHR